MASPFVRLSAAAIFILSVAGCGGGGSDPLPPPVTPPTTSIKGVIDAAAANPANDSSTNTASAFTVLQNGGLPAVTVTSPPKVNFTVFSSGAVVKTLTTSNVSFAIAKLVPGTNGNPDQWVNYVYRTETAAAGVGPNDVPVLASAKQATTDSKTATQLVFNADGYYTYTFGTDITDPSKTNGVVFEPNRTHRIAIQLSYTDGLGETVLVNPYFDFTLDASGKSVAVTDPSKTRKMADVSSCNSCHEKLALHGGGRVDVQYCVMCHNPGTTDANSGNVLTMATMVHKLHSGRLLHSKAAAGGENYAIWGYRDSKHDYTEVGFPQDLRNCTKCHSGANPATPQGDNWKTRPSKEACLTCHANNAGSAWDTSHLTFVTVPGTEFFIGPNAKAKDIPNSACANCHKPGSNLAPERVHWNQNEENAANYRMNIESVVFNDTPDKKGRSVTVKYFLSDPTNGNAAYNLITPDCTAAAPNICSNTSRFGNLRMYVAYQNMVGQSTATTEFSSYNNGGSSANVYAYRGTNDGSNKYTAIIPIADDSAIMVAAGTARVVTIGQIKEAKLQVKWATDPRPEAVPLSLVNTVVQHAFREFAISGPLNPRRTIVSNEKCNVCHGALGTTTGSNTVDSAFHSGARNTVESCVLCHDANRSSSTVMTSGLNLQESYHFKRMIHGIHGNSKRTYPFTHGNSVVGAFNKDGTSATGGAPLASNVANYAAEVIWPGVGINCNVCHVNDSYKNDRGPLGSVVSPRVTNADPLQYLVISPKAASCTACHDSANSIGHVTAFGGAGFGNLTQAQFRIAPQEICSDCHSSGGFKGVDIVHGQK